MWTYFYVMRKKPIQLKRILTNFQEKEKKWKKEIEANKRTKRIKKESEKTFFLPNSKEFQVLRFATKSTK